MALDELKHYKRMAQQQRDNNKGERDWDNEVLVGLFPHLEAVDTRLSLMGSLMDLAMRLPEVLTLVFVIAVLTLCAGGVSGHSVQSQRQSSRHSA